MSHNFWFNITTYIINYDKVRPFSSNAGTVGIKKHEHTLYQN